MDEELFGGEIWTDAHGVATVTLPVPAQGNLVIELEALADGVSARLAREPGRRRFTVTTSEPHVKVAWRATTGSTHVAARSPKEER